MPADPLRRINPHEKVTRFPRVAHNLFLDLLKPRGGPARLVPSGLETSTEIDVRNTTGAPLDEFAIVAVAAPTITYAENQTEFKANRCLDATAPTATATIAILKEPLPDQAIGRATLVGLTPVFLDRTSTAHTHAAPTSSTTKLTSGATGPARILWPAAGTGSVGDQWAMVVLGGGDTGAGPDFVRVTSNTTVGGGWYPGKVQKRVGHHTGWADGEDVFIENAKSGVPLVAGEQYQVLWNEDTYLGKRTGVTRDCCDITIPDPGCDDDCANFRNEAWTPYAKVCYLSGTDVLGTLGFTPSGWKPLLRIFDDGFAIGMQGNLFTVTDPLQPLTYAPADVEVTFTCNPPATGYTYTSNLTYLNVAFGYAHVTWGGASRLLVFTPTTPADPKSPSVNGGGDSLTVTCDPYCLRMDFAAAVYELSGALVTYGVYRTFIVQNTADACVTGCASGGGGGGGPCITTPCGDPAPTTITGTWAVASGSPAGVDGATTDIPFYHSTAGPPAEQVWELITGVGSGSDLRNFVVMIECTGGMPLATLTMEWSGGTAFTYGAITWPASGSPGTFSFPVPADVWPGATVTFAGTFVCED